MSDRNGRLLNLICAYRIHRQTGNFTATSSKIIAVYRKLFYMIDHMQRKISDFQLNLFKVIMTRQFVAFF